jgi:hypothetical protein
MHSSYTTATSQVVNIMFNISNDIHTDTKRTPYAHLFTFSQHVSVVLFDHLQVENTST